MQLHKHQTPLVVARRKPVDFLISWLVSCDTKIKIVALATNGDLIALARRMCKFAYSPYSTFRVGAAVLDSSGKISYGANVENISYGLTICAERVAIFNAVTGGCRAIVAIGISAQTDEGHLSPAMPCGACLQVMSEFMGPDGVVIIDGDRAYSLAELLPFPFKVKLD